MRIKVILVGLAGIVAGALLTAAVVVLAGNPAGPATPPANTFSYTLEDIYDRLNGGAPGAKTAFAEPAGAPGPTGHTLDEVMDLAPALDHANGATETHVLDGKTFWGLTAGQWGPATGTMSIQAAAVYTPGTGDQAISAGYQDGSSYVAGDSDLVSCKIRRGVSLFGVDGAVTTCRKPGRPRFSTAMTTATSS